MIPSFTSGCASLAVLLAIRIVQESASSQPPPRAKPLIAQIEGFPIVSSRWNTPWPNWEKSFPSTGVRCASSPISAPATKDFSPAPVRISTRTDASSRASTSASRSSSTVLRLSAFNTFGRLKVMNAMPSFFSYSKFPKSMVRRPPRSPLKFHGLGFLRIRVVVEAAPGLAASPAGEHHALQQRRAGEAALAEFIEHDVGDVIRSVKSDEIEQRERSHGMPAAQLHRIVDIFNRPDAFFECANGIEEVRNQKPVDDKSRAVVRANRRLTQLRAQSYHFFVHGGVRGDGFHNLDKLHHRNRIEKMQANEAVGTFGRGGNFRNGERRRIAGEDRRGRT